MNRLTLAGLCLAVFLNDGVAANAAAKNAQDRAAQQLMSAERSAEWQKEEHAYEAKYHAAMRKYFHLPNRLRTPVYCANARTGYFCKFKDGVTAKQMGGMCLEDWHSCVPANVVKRTLRNPNQHFCTEKIIGAIPQDAPCEE